MKDIKLLFWWLIDISLIVVMIAAVKGIFVLDQYSSSLPVVRTISVDAEEKATIVPDIAQLTFAIVVEGKDPKKLQEESSTKITKAIESVKLNGVKAVDIKTDQYNLSPKYVYDEKNKESFIQGYTLTQGASVKIRDLEKIADILSGLTNAGMNQINGPLFIVDDPEIHLSAARAKAFEKAREKAEAMARQNKVSIGRVVSFAEYRDGGVIYARALEGGDIGGPIAPPIEPGTEELAVHISVTYELK